MSSGRSGVVRSGGKNPVWTEATDWDVALHFDVAPCDTAHLLVHVFDKDVFSDDVIGIATVDVTRFLDRAAGGAAESVRKLLTASVGVVVWGGMCLITECHWRAFSCRVSPPVGAMHHDACDHNCFVEMLFGIASWPSRFVTHCR